MIKHESEAATRAVVLTMKAILKEFFGFGGYQRSAEGYMSWQHLLFVTSLVCIMFVCAILIGKKKRNLSPKQKNNVVVIAAILIDSVEIFKLVILTMRSGEIDSLLYNLPLFLCSIQLIARPMAAFCKGRIKEASLDFVAIFGLLGALMGTYFAGQNYGCYPVLSIDNVASGITHCIAGFGSLYVLITGEAEMKKKNIPITAAILGGFCVMAYVANILLDYNYMFLRQGDGTPYDIFYNLVNGNQVSYPIIVVGLFVLYIMLFYHGYYEVQSARKKNGTKA